jgi:2-oxoglutarate dehydrogenase E1 component
MAKDSKTETFLRTSFLHGANAAYLEDLQARYEKNPSSVDSEWQAFFAGLKEESGAPSANARGASWKQPHWPVPMNGELVAALDGNWIEVEKGLGRKIEAKAQKSGADLSSEDVMQATRDSVRALFMIRAFRARGHLEARLDPLEIEPRVEHPELDPKSYGFTEADYDRKIFIDNVLGLEFATIREMLTILRRTYCETIGVEFMHVNSPDEKA